MAHLHLVFINVLLYYSVVSTDLCRNGFSCITLKECRPKSSSSNIIYPCHSGLNLICCPSNDAFNVTTNLENRKASLFPVDCGTIFNENKITGGKNADLGQFPWMALLGYKQQDLNITEFLCGGTVVTQRYVLTAAHCITVDKRRALAIVRLGEHDLKSEVDCVRYGKATVCADKHVDVPVETIVTHPRYNPKTLKNDVALVRVLTNIPTTDYIRPICLPFERNLERAELAGQKFTISGWGKTNSKNLGGSTYLQYANVQVWEQDKCNNILPVQVRPIADTQLCAIGKREDACKGDSGGPLANSTVDLNGDLRVFQVGIVSFAPTMTCGIEELPPVYTRVDRYLQWITDNIIE